MMKHTKASLSDHKPAPHTAREARTQPVIFGLRYLEEEAAEIHDVIGCQRIAGSCTSCDDVDYIN